MPSADRPLIAHVIHHLFIGGLENGLVNLINGDASGRYRHCIVCAEDFSDFRDRITRLDVPVYAMHKSTLSRTGLFRGMLDLFGRLRPSVVHSRNLSGLDALPAAWVAGVPLRIHGEHGWDVTDLKGTRFMPRLLRRLHSPLVHRYVTVSKDLREHLIARLGVSPSRITQIYNGVDISRYAPSEAKPASVMPADFYGLGKIVVGHVGRLQAVKDQATLVRAMGRLLRDNADLRKVLRLAIVGDGPEAAALAACVRQESLSQITWMPGARNDVSRVYQCFDVFALPSLREGISNTVLEAMATGLPVIVTAVGGNVELVSDNVNGRCIPASDPRALAAAIRAYITDKSLRSRHGEASRLRAVNEFSIERMVQSYIGLYDSLLGGAA